MAIPEGCYEMTDAETPPGFGSALLPAVRAFELVKGTEFIVFLAAHESGLPGDGVRRELRVAARHGRNAATRGLVDTLISDGTAGIVGGAAWAGITAMCTATRAYLRSRRQVPAVSDMTTVVARLKTVCAQITGSVPAELSAAAIQKLDDGRWYAQFTHSGVTVRATLNPACSIISWIQE